MNIEQLRDEFEKTKKVYDCALIKFIGVDGFDVYNCSIPFVWNGNKYIYGRVEKRDEWARSWVRLFKETGKDEFTLVKESMIYQLEDPYIAEIGGELVLGGTHVPYRCGEPNSFSGYFYRGKDLEDLFYFTTGPDGMKDIRLVELPEGIGIFSRPNGRVGFTMISDINELNDEVISNAKIIDMFDEDEYGGCNQCYYLGGSLIGVIAHQAYSNCPNMLRYINISCVYDYKADKVLDKKVIGTITCYPHVDGSKKEPGKPERDMSDVSFSSGIVLRNDGKVDLYSGLCDVCEGRITIDDPFSEYRQ